MTARLTVASPLRTRPAIMSPSNPWATTSNLLSGAVRVAGEQL
jgi:hypothetical protein